MKRFLLMLTLTIAAMGMLLAAAPVGAAQRQRCFQETGFCASGAILDYWERNGGLPVFGYPIGAEYIGSVEDWSGPIQWFERDRLEDHGRIGVLAGRLGAEVLETQGRPWQSLPRPASTPPGCRFFTETGHTLCGAFLSYWTNNGGLARFGYPVSEPFQETLPTGNEQTWTGRVQYFERRRMEYHPEHAGTPYEVLLGLLAREAGGGRLGGGNQYFGRAAPPLEATARAYPELLSAAAPIDPFAAQIKTQPFEHGSIVWAGYSDLLSARQLRLWVVYFDSSRNSLVWESYPDTWAPGQPERGGETPPPGLYEPARSIGKLWRENGRIRNTLGWATAPEQEETGFLQLFNQADALYRATTDRVFIFIHDSRAKDIERVR